MVLYGFFHFFLRFHKILLFNRFYLISSLVFSLIIPLVVIPVKSNFTVTQSLDKYTYTTGLVLQSKEIVMNHTPLFTYHNIIPVLFIVFSTVLLIRFALNIFRIIAKTIKCKKIENGNITLILVEEKTLPYSFFRYVFVNKSDFENGKIEKELLIHEEAHCLQHHSIDILILEVVNVFFWFNPAIWLFRKAIILNHEYYADNKVLTTSESFGYPQLLINLVIQNNTNCLASNFKYSTIKNRLIMMTKSRPSHNAILRKIAGILLLLMLAMTLTFSQEIKQQDNMIDYSGKWVLNNSQSKSYLSEGGTSIMVISQDRNSVTMDITFATFLHGEPINRTMKYVFNESIVRKHAEGDSTVITCTQAPDGKSFSIIELNPYMYNSVERVSKRISVYTLSKDGKNLIIKSDDTLPEGSITPESERHEKRVYDKSL